jgi:type I restriction enzyme M protein
MITGEIKSKVDGIWNTMWSGGISNPLSVIEQLTYLLFIKRLDELHTLKERKAARTGKPIEDPVFGSDQQDLRWSRFKDAAPETMFETIRDKVFPFIKTLGSGTDGDSTYSHHMKDALFMMPTVDGHPNSATDGHLNDASKSERFSLGRPRLVMCL